MRVDAWSNRLELIKAKPIALNSPGEKMPFEVTPFFPFLVRFGIAAPVPEKAPDRGSFLLMRHRR